MLHNKIKKIYLHDKSEKQNLDVWNTAFDLTVQTFLNEETPAQWNDLSRKNN